MADDTGELLFRAAWSAFARRIGVGAGALVALAAVLADVPPRIAALRGAVTVLVILAVARAGLRLVLSARRAGRGDDAEPKQGTR